MQLVLLCSAVGDKSVEEFATNEAIQATEIYEFVQLLGNHEYEMPTLQVSATPSVLDSLTRFLTAFRYSVFVFVVG